MDRGSAGPAPDGEPGPPQPLGPAELAARLAAGDTPVLLDVREAEELAICKIEGAIHIPLGELAVRHHELDPDAEIVCICHHGVRSASAAAGLRHVGFDGPLWNLTGGVDRWAREVDPSMPRY